jgi:hypothetical protein
MTQTTHYNTVAHYNLEMEHSGTVFAPHDRNGTQWYSLRTLL